MKQGAYCHDCGERLVGPPEGVAPDDFWPVNAIFWTQTLEARRQHCAETGHWAMLFTGLSTDVREIPPQFREILGTWLCVAIRTPLGDVGH